MPSRLRDRYPFCKPHTYTARPNMVHSCKLPNVNPLTGERHAAEPDKTLRSQRSVDEGAPKLGCLGMQLTPLFPRTSRPEYMQTVVEVGMAVHVLERDKHHYIPI